jgi:putative nucleotidyltransferase with HDIG domain
MITLKELTRRINDIPPLPDIVVKLLTASRDPDVSMRDMVELIKLDPALTTKVLRLCNSSYYGLPRKINSLREALVYIGTDTLVNFILAGCLASFYQQAQDGYGLATGDLWRHSVGCAIAAQRLSPEDDDAQKAEAYTAGLLHDVGKIILNTYVREKFAEIIQIVDKKGISFEEAERKVLGFSHADAGAAMAKDWNLPDALVEAIAHHQNPTRAKDHPQIVSQVHLGNVLCISFGIGLGSDGLAYTFHPAAMAAVGLEVSDLYRLSLEIHDQFTKAEELIGLVSATPAGAGRNGFVTNGMAA